jgi:hypothetical protein
MSVTTELDQDPGNPPEAALWLRIPDDCRMRGEFEIRTGELPDIHILLGTVDDDKHLLFERSALERFIDLAQRMLAIPLIPGSASPQAQLA